VINLAKNLDLSPGKRRLVEIKLLKEAQYFHFLEIKMCFANSEGPEQKPEVGWAGS